MTRLTPVKTHRRFAPFFLPSRAPSQRTPVQVLLSFSYLPSRHHNPPVTGSLHAAFAVWLIGPPALPFSRHNLAGMSPNACARLTLARRQARAWLPRSSWPSRQGFTALHSILYNFELHGANRQAQPSLTTGRGRSCSGRAWFTWSIRCLPLAFAFYCGKHSTRATTFGWEESACRW